MSMNVTEIAGKIMANTDLKDEVMAVINDRDDDALLEILNRFDIPLDEDEVGLLKTALEMWDKKERGEDINLDDLKNAAGGLMDLFR